METRFKDKKDYKKPRLISNGVNIQVNVQDIVASSDSGLSVTGVTSTSGILYYAVPVFISKFRLSYSTIARNIENFRFHPDAYNYYLKLGGKNYVSCGIIGGKRKHTGRFNNEDYAQWLQCFNWNLTGTVSYSDKNSVLTVRRTMEKLFKKLRQKYYNKPLVFFYVSEPNPAGDGFHNHFILGYQDELSFSDVKSFIDNILKSDKLGNRVNTKIQEYISAKDFISYIVKQIHKCQDGYDFLSNHLIN